MVFNMIFFRVRLEERTPHEKKKTPKFYNVNENKIKKKNKNKNKKKTIKKKKNKKKFF